MGEDLGARLLRAGLVTRAQLAEARRTAPSHGAALVQALAQQGLSEDALAGFFVAEGYGPVLGPEDFDAATPGALARIPASMARELIALPVRETPVGLVVAMVAPNDEHSLGELRRALDGPVLPTVARASELRAALARFYPAPRTTDRVGAFDPPREEQPVLELVQRKPPAPGAFGGSTRGAARVEARATLGPRLVAEEGETFVPLVRQKTAPTGTERTAPAPAEKTAPAPVEKTALSRIDTPEPFRRKVITKTFEKLELGASAPPRPRSIIPPEHESWDAPEPPNKVDKERLASIDSSRRLPPIGEQLSAIRRSHDRDEVAQLACRAATSVARSAVLLALRKDVLRGWDGWGGSLSKDGVRNLWIPTKSPSVFREVLTTKAPHRGPGGHTAADALFRAAVASRGGELVVCPVVAGGRVVAVLAADDVRHAGAGAERIETLARAVGEAFERIIVDGKQR